MADKMFDTVKVDGNVSKKTFAIVTFSFQALVFKVGADKE